MDESLREQLTRAGAGLPHPAGEPARGSVLGEPVARSLSEVDGPVDVVDVFRPAGEAPKIARQAIDIGAKVLWLQEGIESQEAKRIAEAAGLTVVMNRCMGETHAQLGLGRRPG